MRDPAYILCGGASTRMGTCKATLLLDGERLMDKVATIVQKAGFQPHFIIKSNQNITSVATPIITEQTEEFHPLYGVGTALQHCSAAYALIMACDLPYVTPKSLSRFHSCTVPTIAMGEQLQPLIGWYPKDWSTKAFDGARKQLSMKQFAKDVDVLYFPPTELHNCNHPEDL